MHLLCLRILVSHYKGINYVPLLSGGGGGGGGGWDWIDHCFIAGWHIYRDIIQSIFHEAILFYIMYQHEHTCTYMNDMDG